MPNITFNGRFLTQSMTGVQRYSWNVLKHMDEALAGQPNVHVEVVTPRGAQLLAPLKNIRHRSVGLLTGHAWEQLELPFHVGDWLISPGNVGPISVRRQTVIVHDLTYLIVPKSYSWTFRVAYRAIHTCIRIQGISIAGSSRYSARQLEPAFRRESISHYGGGIEHIETRFDFENSLSGVPKKYVLLVGKNLEHKNYSVVYGITKKLLDRGIVVAVAGDKGAGEGPTSAGVFHFGRVTDGELRYLYENALALLMPSRNEGFGLPVVEAMALGVPVICSPCGSLPEVGGDAVQYADPDKPLQWLEAILRIDNDDAERSRFVDAGLRRAQTFSWRQTAGRLLEDVVREAERL